MANKTYQGRIVQKHDSSANWAKATNFIPLKGEIIIYDDLNKIKIGDGTTKVNDLDFSSCLPDGGTAGDALVKDTDGGKWETPVEAILVSLPTGILKSDGTTISQAVPGVDYHSPTKKYTFTVTDATQSTFTIPFDFNNDSGTLTVYYNGVMMKEKDNYTISNNTLNLVDWTAKKGDYLTVMGIEGAASVNVNVDDIGLFSTTKNGVVPKSDGSTTKYLRADGSWSTIDKTPVIGTNTNYAIYIGSTQPASGTTPLLWIDTTSSTGYLKYRTSTTGTWTTVPVAWA